MTVIDALNETELNALSDLLRRLGELTHLCHLAQSHIDRAQTPSGNRLISKSQAVAEAIEIWSAARHAVLKAEAEQRDNGWVAKARRGG